MWLRPSVVFFFLLAAPAWARTCHYSWWSDNPSPYLKAIQKAQAAVPLKLAPGQRIRAGIVTHHFLANALMVRFFATLSAESSPETFVLIGPNHFHHGLANISVSSLPWKTPFGIMETNPRVVQQIRSETNLPEDPEAFTGEHSVGVLIPFFKYYFPRSRVVPILLDVNAKPDQLRELRRVIRGSPGEPASAGGAEHGLFACVSRESRGWARRAGAEGDFRAGYPQGQGAKHRLSERAPAAFSLVEGFGGDPSAGERTHQLRPAYRKPGPTERDQLLHHVLY